MSDENNWVDNVGGLEFFRLNEPIHDPLVIKNGDHGFYFKLGVDGTVSGELVEKYPDAADALTELSQRIVAGFGL